MSGAQTDGSDTYLSLGYMLEGYADTCSPEVTIDLEKIDSVDKIRIFSSHNHAFNPDRILAEYSSDGRVWSYIGESTGRFINGWASIVPDRDIKCRYVRLTYNKTNFENWKTWLILEEIEILKKI